MLIEWLDAMTVQSIDVVQLFEYTLKQHMDEHFQKKLTLLIQAIKE